MADTYRSDIDLRPLFNKLGHKLEEIRVRSLNNLLSKLEYNLLGEIDLVQERHLFIRLLEWFNFPTCPKRKEVLELLQRLTKHSSAATLVVEIGGVEFLTQMRDNVEPALHPTIDATLDQLFHLPCSPPAIDQNAECVYVVNTGGTHAHNHTHTVSSNQTGTSVWSSVTPRSQPGQSSGGQSSGGQSSGGQSSGGQYMTPQSAPHPAHTAGWMTSPADSQDGYFGRSQPNQTQQQAKHFTNERPSCFYLSTFPWISLMPTDRHVLSSTDGSLRNRDPSLVVSACEFLSDVVFQDFPAEVFLQRPNIVKSLLSLLEVEPVGGVSVAQPAIHALHDLSVCLTDRLSFYQDPALYTPKQDFSQTVSSSSSGTSLFTHSLASSDTRPSLIGRSDPRQGGDGQDGDYGFTRVDGGEEMEVEDVRRLQFMQWSLPQYSVTVLHAAIPLLASPHPAIVSDTLQLLHKLHDILEEVADGSRLWDERSVSCVDVIEKCEESFELLTDALQYHHHTSLSSSTPPGDLSQHQLAFIGIANFTTSFIKALVPLDKVEQAVPELAYSLFTMLALDPTLSLSHSKICSTLLPYVEKLAPEVYTNYLTCRQVVTALKATTDFLSKWPQQLSVDAALLTGLAGDGLPSLYYHQHLPYVDATLRLASHVSRKSKVNVKVVNQGRQMVLALLSHCLDQVKVRAYLTVRDIVKESVGIDQATDPSLSASTSINFLLHRHVMYEIICFGLGSNVQKVSELAGQILLHLLQGKLLMTSQCWGYLMDALTPVLPVLQGFAAQEAGLGESILGMLEVRGEALSLHERLRGTLRLMYRQETRMRSEGLGRLAWYLSQEPGSGSKLPEFSDIEVRELSNIFILQTPTYIQDEESGRSVFQEDGLKKVYEIFSSEMVDEDVKKSALDQLMIMLQDPALHACFKRLDGFSLILHHLHAGVTRPATGGHNPSRPATGGHNPSRPATGGHNPSRPATGGHNPSRPATGGHNPSRPATGGHNPSRPATGGHNPSRPATGGHNPSRPATGGHNPSRPATGGHNPSRHMLPAVLKILRHMIQADSSLRHQVAHTTDMYYSIMRAALICSSDDTARKEASHLLALLLWDELAALSVWDLEGAAHPQSSSYSLPAFITSRFRLPFRCSQHHAVSPYMRPGPPAADPLQEGLLAQTIRLAWWREWTGGVQDFTQWCSLTSGQDQIEDTYTGPLRLTKVDRRLVAASYLPVRLQHLITMVENATSHSDVMRGICDVMAYMTASGVDKVGPLLATHGWYSVVDRFLRVKPSSNVDETLLADLLKMVTELLMVPRPDPELLTWLSGALHDSQGALVSLLSRSEVTDDLPEATQRARRLVNRRLLRFVHVFVGKLPYSLTSKRVAAYNIEGIVTQAFLSRLKSTDAAHFYNLASLERTLLALVHITSRPGWSAGAPDADSFGICCLMLHSLLEVILAFHVGRGGMSMSYMGRGVTRGATLCLRHLAYEMSSQIQLEDWPRNWLYTSQSGSGSASSSGLEWLTPLWSYRDPEVRAAGLGIAVALTHTDVGRVTMVTQCEHIQGGIWGAAFTILLDQSECSLVRQQAALLLINLTSQPFPTKDNEVNAAWQGPVIRNDQTQESVVGLDALLALLHHTQFYQEVLYMLNNYYSQATIRPVTVVTHTDHSTIITSSQNTLTTSGTVSPPTVQGGVWKPVTSTPMSDASSTNSTHHLASSHRATPDTHPHSHQQQAAARVSDSALSSSDDSGEYSSVSGPGLVAVLAQLLRNLVHLAPEHALDRLSNEGLLKILASLVDVHLVETYMSESSSSAHHRVVVMDVLHMHVTITSLLTTCATSDSTICRQVLQETTLLRQLTQLLATSVQGDGHVGTLCESVWTGVFNLLRVLLQQEGQEALRLLTPVLTKHWYTIAARCVNVIQTVSAVDQPHWFSCLYFLAVLLTEEGRCQTGGQTEDDVMTVSYRLDNVSKTAEDAGSLSGPSGAVLCGALIQVHDTVWLQQGEKAVTAKTAVMAAFKALLTLSATAKDRALEGGLVESLCDQLKRQTTALNMAALEAPKTSKAAKKKEAGKTSEIVLTLDLLRNFMYNSYHVKLAAYECSLAQCLHKLWAWSQIEPSLQTSLLTLLSTYTARCPPACTSLVFTSAMGGIERGPSTTQYSPHSLVHCLIKLSQKESVNSGNMSTVKAVYAILATLTLSQECRGLLWKSNFLREFSRLTPRKTKKSRVEQVVEMCWLRLFVNLSFSTDGQAMILKVNEATTLLVEYAKSSSEAQMRCAMLIVRNLSYHTTNKPKLLANDDVSPLLVRGVEEGSDHIQAVASSALFALTYNCQKAKVVLKTTATVRRLQETYNTLVYLPTRTSEEERSVDNLKNILTVLKS